MTQNQFDALVLFDFDTGALYRSTLLKLLNSGNREGAANEFLKWSRAAGRVLSVLVRRREEERKLFQTL